MKIESLHTTYLLRLFEVLISDGIGFSRTISNNRIATYGTIIAFYLYFTKKKSKNLVNILPLDKDFIIKLKVIAYNVSENFELGFLPEKKNYLHFLPLQLFV